MSFTITSRKQLPGINKYSEIIPTKLVEFLMEDLEDAENDEDFIYELHDGWRYCFCEAHEVPNLDEYGSEHVTVFSIGNDKWVSSLSIENNEASCTYVFKNVEGDSMWIDIADERIRL